MNYQKYLKYKNKYLALKNQIGGNPNCELLPFKSSGYSISMEKYVPSLSKDVIRFDDPFLLPTGSSQLERGCFYGLTHKDDNKKFLNDKPLLYLSTIPNKEAYFVWFIEGPVYPGMEINLSKKIKVDLRCGGLIYKLKKEQDLIREVGNAIEIEYMNRRNDGDTRNIFEDTSVEPISPPLPVISVPAVPAVPAVPVVRSFFSSLFGSNDYDEQIIDISYEGNLIYYFINNYVKDNIDNITVIVENDERYMTRFNLKDKELDASKLCEDKYCSKIYHLDKFRPIIAFSIKLKFLKIPFPDKYSYYKQKLIEEELRIKKYENERLKKERLENEAMDKEFINIKRGKVGVISEKLYLYLLGKNKIIASDWVRQESSGFMGYPEISYVKKN
jgi:hypothetical protein